MKCMHILLVAFLVVSFSPALGENGELKPVILVYTGNDPGFAEMLGDVIEADDAIASEVQVVETPDILSVAAALPQTECIIVYASNQAEMEGLEDPLIAFFEQGGGLIGMRDICYEPYAADLAVEVFPTHANDSVQQLSPRETRARTYVLEEDSEITSGLPEQFPLLSMGTYFSADSEGNYLEIRDVEYEVAYVDQETGSPLVLAYVNEHGGRSVALPGIWTIPNARVDIYYGNLLQDENFVNLFSNMVLWAAKGSSRFPGIQPDLQEKIEEAKGRADRLKEEAEEARRRENTRQLIFLVAIWAGGLLVCGVIIKKMILVPIEVEA